MSETPGDFFKAYFDYIGRNESPMIYHRWSAISIIGALLGRQFFLPFGHGFIYPNNYIMLIGPPAARKGTAINPAKRIIRDSGYHHFGADRTSAERFVIDLHRSSLVEGVDLSDINAVENINLDEPSQLYSVAGEFADFLGVKNMNFINLLTNLWDNLDQYEHPKIHSKSIFVVKPTVNILCGTTPVSLVDTVPPEAIGQGFTSRYLIIFSAGTGELITWPDKPDTFKTSRMVERLKAISKKVKGKASIEEDAKPIFDRIYKTYKGIDDPRFQYYNGRRFTHLLKLSMILCAMDLRTEISKKDAIRANTILDAAEQVMPRGLGELGRSRHSEVTNNILEICHKEKVGFKDLWRKLSHDLDKEAELTQILRNLISAGKLQQITLSGKPIYKRVFTEEAKWDQELLDPEYLTEEERR